MGPLRAGAERFAYSGDGIADAFHTFTGSSRSLPRISRRRNPSELTGAGVTGGGGPVAETDIGIWPPPVRRVSRGSSGRSPSHRVEACN